jgi:hypothetical protein
MKKVSVLIISLVCLSCFDPPPGRYYDATECEGCKAYKRVFASGRIEMLTDSVEQYYYRISPSMFRIEKNGKVIEELSDMKFSRDIGKEKHGNGLWESKVNPSNSKFIRMKVINFKKNKFVRGDAIEVSQVFDGEYNPAADTVYTYYYPPKW